MMKQLRLVIGAGLIVLGLAVPAVKAAEADPCQVRRSQLMAHWDSTAMAVFYSGTSKLRTGDVTYPFRVDNNFYYLTGCDQENAALILIPGGTIVNGAFVREVLFIPSRTSVWRMDLTQNKPELKFPGFAAVLPSDQFSDFLDNLLSHIKTLYIAGWPNGSFIFDPYSGKKYFLERDGKKAISEKHPGLAVKSATSLLTAMRKIKSAEELAALQKAIDITCAAARDAARSAEPGMYEYELQAVIEYVFTRQGAQADGFPCIVGSGPNSLILHYEDNRRRMQAGDMVVMDIGAEFDYYSGDVTRTIPVDGKFSPQQRQIYEIVLAANEAAIEVIKPGLARKVLDQTALKVISEGLTRLGILQDAQGAARYMPHGVSHPIGLQVHDVDDNQPLQPGEVITIEPGIYIPAGGDGVTKQYGNIGIRIEDDVLVTDTGHRVLSDKAPKKIADIEKLMKQKGTGNRPAGE